MRNCLIESLIASVRDAQGALDRALMASFPPSAEALAILQEGQRTPTPVTIRYPDGIGLICVQLTNTQARGSRRFRSIPYTAVRLIDPKD